MGTLDEISGILKQYESGGAKPPADVNQHFDQVAQAVPAGTLADGVAHALRSDSTPAFGDAISSLYSQANGPQKAGLLNQLVAALGPTAAGAAAGGALADVVQKGGTVTADQAQQVSPNAVKQLADRAQSADGSVVDKVSAFAAQHPTLVKGLGATALALVMSKIANRR
ncbi:MAG TPA: hypothetical protein VEI06_05205 [Gemmatimonadaceae bacterium]|nr:hypothetical protein [Gemmatimonadaceae bacterium]